MDPRTRVRHAMSGDEAWAVVSGARLNVYAIGLNALWNTVNTIILPERVDATAPAALRGSAVGLIGLIGIGLAVLVQPIAGRVSDGLPLPDQRGPYIAAGTLLALPCLALFGWAPAFGWLLLAYVLLQLVLNVSQTAFQALIPDIVPPEGRGIASGSKNALTVAGAAIGLVGARVLLDLAGMGAALAFLGAVLLGTALLSRRWVPAVPPRADPGQPRPPRPSVAALARLLNPRDTWRSLARVPREHPVFRYAVLAQFLVLLGTYPAQRFLLYFLRDRFGAAAERNASAGLVVAILLAAVAAAVSGVVSDRVGRVPLLRASIWLAGIGLIGVAVAPTLPLVALAGAPLAVGLGTFQAVNWALLSDDIPEGEGARFFGVANVATAGASALAGLFGPLADLLSPAVGTEAYPITFAVAGAVALTALWPLRRLTGQLDRQPKGKTGQDGADPPPAGNAPAPAR